MKLIFEDYKDQLFDDFLSENHHDRFLRLIETLHGQGRTKKEIYELFLDFFKEIQIDSRTKGDEMAYDKLADFLDSFSDYGIGFKILPNDSIN